MDIRIIWYEDMTYRMQHLVNDEWIFIQPSIVSKYELFISGKYDSIPIVPVIHAEDEDWEISAFVIRDDAIKFYITK